MGDLLQEENRRAGARHLSLPFVTAKSLWKLDTQTQFDDNDKIKMVSFEGTIKFSEI